MKNKNTVLFKIMAFLIILALLLPNISVVGAMTDTTGTTSDEIGYRGSLDLATGEMKTEVVEHHNTNGRSYIEKGTKGYFPEELQNQIGGPLVGPQNPNQAEPYSIIPPKDDRIQIPNQWRNI